MVDLIGSQWRPPIWRVIAAFIVGPFAGALVLLAFVLVKAPRPSVVFWMDAAAIMLFSYVSALLFGIPLYLLLRRWVWVRWWVPALAGSLLTLVELTSVSAFSLYMIDNGSSGSINWPDPVTMLSSLSICFATGAVGGLAFWLVGSFGNKRRSLASAEIFA